MLIHRELGSFFMLGSLLFNQKIVQGEETTFETDHCGECRACVDACPTDAIDPKTRTLTAEDCIATFTIEHFQEDVPAPKEYHRVSSAFLAAIFVKMSVLGINTFFYLEDLLRVSQMGKKILRFFLARSIEKIISELERMSNRAFVRMFKDTVFARTGRKGILKNLRLFR